MTCPTSPTRSGSAAREGLRRRLITRLAAERAVIVLTDTRFSQSEIQAHLGLAAQRIHVVALGAGVPAWFDGAAPRTDGREPLVLFVGSIFNRRRVPDLIAAFRLVLASVPDAPASTSSARTARTRGRTSTRSAGHPARAIGSGSGRTCRTRNWRTPIAAPRRSRSSPSTRASACRPSRRWRAASRRSCSTRPSPGKSAAGRRATCRPATCRRSPPRSSICSPTRTPARPCCARPTACSRGTRGPTTARQTMAALESAGR